MKNYICKTCGTQFPASQHPPAQCPICSDERQYIGWEGQQWTTLKDLQENHHTMIKTVEPNLTGIGMDPGFAIGQRALLIQSPQGNILWDCISLIDDETVSAVEALGGISAIAISHPHFYSSMMEWSHIFNAPIYLHEANRKWVMRQDEKSVQYWSGDVYPLSDEITLLKVGGHFKGSTVLHWASGADGKGVILSGDTVYVVSDRRYVSFMYSYPNLIPLSAQKVRAIGDALEPYPFDRIYSGWWGRVVEKDAKNAVNRSVVRYLAALERD